MLIRAYEQLLDTCIRGGTITTHTKAFCKKEITLGTDWPRVITAREEGLRVLSAVIYHAIEKTVYADDSFIKGLDPLSIIDKICERLGQYKTHVCLDIGSYDSA